MKILYIYSTDVSKGIYTTLVKMGYIVEEYARKQANSQLIEEEIELLVEYAKIHGITHFMSTHLIYNVAVAACEIDIKYISVIWDAPYIKMYTPFGKLDNCWFSVFDKEDAERFKKAGLKHVLYQPLAIDQEEIKHIDFNKYLSERYLNEICFIRNLYDRNKYDEELKRMPAILQDYFTSIFEEAAFRWDGKNRIYGKVGSEIIKCMQKLIPEFQLDNTYDLRDEQVFEIVYLVRKIANIERVGVLNVLAEYFKVTCHTYFTGGEKKLKNMRVLPPVMNRETMLIIFAGSKINLNLSLKGIEGGTPKRIMDICEAGGFALTNYCQETGELFKEGEEIEMFRTPEELVDKVSYYLEHEDERKRIAQNGQQKVLQNYTYEKQLYKLMKWVCDDN